MPVFKFLYENEKWTHKVKIITILVFIFVHVFTGIIYNFIWL